MQTTNQIHQRRETTELSTYELRNGVGYSTPNEQRGYTPPPTPEPFTPPRVSASAVKVDGSVVEQAHAAFTNAKTAFEKFLNDIPREHYSADGLKAQIKKFGDTDAAKAVDIAVANVRDRADKATAQVEKIRRDLSPNGDTAAELRATRYWDRTKPGLDNAKEGAFGRAQKLIANADREELGVLLQELPAYLEARGLPDGLDRHRRGPSRTRIRPSHKATSEGEAGTHYRRVQRQVAANIVRQRVFVQHPHRCPQVRPRRLNVRHA